MRDGAAKWEREKETEIKKEVCKHIKKLIHDYGLYLQTGIIICTNFYRLAVAYTIISNLFSFAML